MEIKNVYCLFEQSGTFKGAFNRLGYYAVDLDISDDFFQTDIKTDLFVEIENCYDGLPSVFDSFDSEDLLFAFFPCTRFEGMCAMQFNGQSYSMRNYSQYDKLQIAMKANNEQNHLYQVLCKLCSIAYKRKLKLIIENPYSFPNYLISYFPIKPAVVDKDRRVDGDFFEKPTMYFFINCHPSNNFIAEPLYSNDFLKIESIRDKVARSMISPIYANRFIRRYII